MANSCCQWAILFNICPTQLTPPPMYEISRVVCKISENYTSNFASEKKWGISEGSRGKWEISKGFWIKLISSIGIFLRGQWSSTKYTFLSGHLKNGVVLRCFHLKWILRGVTEKKFLNAVKGQKGLWNMTGGKGRCEYYMSHEWEI